MGKKRYLGLGAAVLTSTMLGFCNPKGKVEGPTTAHVQITSPTSHAEDPEFEQARDRLTELIKALLLARDLPKNPIEIPTDENGHVVENYNVLEGLRECVQSDPELSCLSKYSGLDSHMNCFSLTDPEALPIEVIFTPYDREDTVVIKGTGLPIDYLENSYTIPEFPNMFKYSVPPITPDELLPDMLGICADIQGAIRSNSGWDTAQKYCKDESISPEECERHKTNIGMDVVLLEETNEVVAENLDNLGVDYQFDGFTYDFTLDDGTPCEIETFAIAGSPEGRPGPSFRTYFKDQQTVYMNCMGRWIEGEYVPEGDSTLISEGVVEGL